MKKYSGKKISLGDKVKDKITDFEGIAIARITFLNGCEQIQVQPQGLTKDGEQKESVFIDIQQLEKVKEEKPKKVKKSDVGGGFRNYP